MKQRSCVFPLAPLRRNKLAQSVRSHLLFAGIAAATIAPVHGAVLEDQTIDTSAAQAPAVSVAAGASLELNRSQVTTTGQGAAALLSRGTLTGTGLTLRTTGLSAQAVEARNRGSVRLTDTQIRTEGLGAVGMQATGVGSTVTLSNGSILTTGDTAYGVASEAGGLVETDNVTIATRHNWAAGVGVFGNGSAVLNDTSVNTQGIEAHGVLLLGDSATRQATARISGSSFTTWGHSGKGINVNYDAAAQVENTQIVTLGDEADGVWLASNTSQASLEGLRIQTAGNSAVGVNNSGGTATLRDVTIATTGRQSHGVYSAGTTGRIDARDLTISLGSFGVGIFALDGSEIRVDTGSVTVRGGGTGLSAVRAAHIEARNLWVTAVGTGARAAVVGLGASLVLDNTNLVAADTGGTALYAYGNSATTLNEASVNGGLLSAPQGAAIAVAGGRLNLNLTNTTVIGSQLLHVNQNTVGGVVVAHGDVRVQALHSTLVGDVLVSGASAGTSELQLRQSTLAGTIQGLDRLDLLDSLWTMTGDSTLGSLNNEGSVAFEPQGAFKTLTLLGDLTGGGLFAMNTDLASQQGELLHIHGTTSGKHTLAIADSGNEPNAANGELRVVKGSGGDGSFSLAGRPHVDAGAFRYTLEQQGDDWLLRNTSRVDPGPDSISDGSNVALASQTAAATLWSAEMNALVKRLGELRMGQDKGGVWARGIGKSFHIDNSRSRGFHQTMQGMEVGADVGIDLQGGRLYVGGMVGAASSKQQFGGGASGEIDSRLVGVYGTWLDASGYYLDAVAKYNWMDNEVKTLANTGTRVKGSHDSRGYAADIEVGRRITLDDGWFVEPQAEFTYTHIGDSRYTASNDLRVRTGAADSVQSRVGALVGRTLTQTSGLAVQPYLKASWVHEATGDSSVTVNNHKLSNRIAGSRGEVGLGGVLQVSEKTKLSLDMEYAKGEHIEAPWAATVGVRYLW